MFFAVFPLRSLRPLCALCGEKDSLFQATEPAQKQDVNRAEVFSTEKLLAENYSQSGKIEIEDQRSQAIAAGPACLKTPVFEGDGLQGACPEPVEGSVKH
jgi:hypothetical protein